MTRDGLREQVEAFAESITATLHSVLGDDVPPLLTTDLAGSRFVVTTERRARMTLTKKGDPFLALRVRYECGWDGPQTYTRVDRSEFHLRSPDERALPLIRYEFDSRMDGGRVPSAHFHIHTDDARIVAALADAGGSTRRSRRATVKAAEGKAQTADVHLPVGGVRFRPCLEDVLQMTVEEFGVDAEDGWRRHLEDGRERWRRLQLRAAIRDAPDEAAATLAELGYMVTAPEGGHPDPTIDRLRLI